MASRKRRHGGKRKSGTDSTRPSRPRPDVAPDTPIRRPFPRPRPPRKNLPLLMATGILMIGWVVFLLVLAVVR